MFFLKKDNLLFCMRLFANIIGVPKKV